MKKIDQFFRLLRSRQEKKYLLLAILVILTACGPSLEKPKKTVAELTVAGGKTCIGMDIVDFIGKWGRPLKYNKTEVYGTAFQKRVPVFVAEYKGVIVFFDEDGKVRFVRSENKD